MGERSLADLQSLVVSGTLSSSPIPLDAALADQAEHAVTPGPRGMTPADRLDVYREQFWLRHVPNLEEDFPTVRRVLGNEEDFRDLARAYLLAFLPRTWDLQQLGSRLPDYLRTRAPWDGDTLLQDAARVDWAFIEVFDAPDVPPFDPRALTLAAEDAWPHAKIVFHPAMHLLRLSYAVHELRTSAAAEATFDRSVQSPSTVVVWRDAACHLRVMSVESDAFFLLEALMSGAELGEACERLARSLPAANDLGPRVSSLFQQWTQNGWVAMVSFPVTEPSSAAHDADGS